jgi:hypothetical protein
MGDEWDSALRKLTREHPKEDHLTYITDRMRSDIDDRACALVVTSLAEMMLQIALTHFLGIRGEKAVRKIFYTFGPLSTLDAKIVMCSSTGIIGPVTTSNLEVVKKIRNVFAHAIIEITFEAPAVQRACNRLKITKSTAAMELAEGRSRNRHTFCFACNDVYETIFSLMLANFPFGDFLSRKLLDHPILP